MRNEWMLISRFEASELIRECFETCLFPEPGRAFVHHLRTEHGLCMLADDYFIQQVSVLAMDISGLFEDDGKCDALIASLPMLLSVQWPISSTEAEEILKSCSKRCWLRNALEPKAQRHWRTKHGLLYLNRTWYKTSGRNSGDSEAENSDDRCKGDRDNDGDNSHSDSDGLDE
jgi:hypothetical protein